MEKACLGSNACIPLCLFITILLGACLQKRLYQAQNMFIEKKLLNKKFLTRKKCEFCLKNYYTKCVAVEMQQTIIGLLPGLKWVPFILLHFWQIRRKVFCNTLQKKSCIVSVEKFMLPRKMLNIYMLKKSPNLSLYVLINIMLIKKHVQAFHSESNKKGSYLDIH